MPRFTYKAKRGPTEIVQGEVDAENEDQAIGKISAEGLMPVKLALYDEKTAPAVTEAPSQPKPKPPAAVSAEGKEDLDESSRIRINHRDFNIFTRQFAILLKANVPLLKIFGVLQTQTENKKFRRALAGIEEHLRGGKSLSETLRLFPHIFSPLYVNMVESGEMSGTLQDVLMRLAEFSEREAEIRNKVKMALVYPGFLMLAGVGTVFILLTFVLPRLMGVFSDLGVQLPAITRFVIAVSRFCQRFWIYILGAAGAVTAFFRTRGLMPAERQLLDDLVLKMPVFGKLVLKSETSRFLYSIELLYEHGIPLHKAVEVAARTVTNAVIRKQLEKLPDQLRGGETLTQSLKSVPHMTEFVTNMVSVGEESGKLGDAVRETASFYEQEANQMIKIAMTLVEPLMILIIGGIIGFIIIAMLLPIFEISALAK